MAFVTDVTDELAMEAALAATIKIFRGLDILVVNAGTEDKYAPLENLKFTDFEKSFVQMS